MFKLGKPKGEENVKGEGREAENLEKPFTSAYSHDLPILLP